MVSIGSCGEEEPSGSKALGGLTVLAQLMALSPSKIPVEEEQQNKDHVQSHNWKECINDEPQE